MRCGKGSPPRPSTSSARCSSSTRRGASPSTARSATPGYTARRSPRGRTRTSSGRWNGTRETSCAMTMTLRTRAALPLPPLRAPLLRATAAPAPPQERGWGRPRSAQGGPVARPYRVPKAAAASPPRGGVHIGTPHRCPRCLGAHGGGRRLCGGAGGRAADPYRRPGARCPVGRWGGRRGARRPRCFGRGRSPGTAQAQEEREWGRRTLLRRRRDGWREAPRATAPPRANACTACASPAAIRRHGRRRLRGRDPRPWRGDERGAEATWRHCRVADRGTGRRRWTATCKHWVALVLDGGPH